MIATGDTLDGKTVSKLDMGVEGLNDRGQIAFHAIFSDNSDTIYFASPALLSGQLALEGAGDISRTLAPLGSVTVEFRARGTAASLYTATAPLIASASGLSYSIAPPPPGTYDVAVKTDKSLRVILPGYVANGTALPALNLPAGDANGDNRVDTSDFGILVGAYNGDITVPGSGYDAHADFNYDGSVDATDFGLLVGEYDVVGSL